MYKMYRKRTSYEVTISKQEATEHSDSEPVFLYGTQRQLCNVKYNKECNAVKVW